MDRKTKGSSLTKVPPTVVALIAISFISGRTRIQDDYDLLTTHLIRLLNIPTN